MKAIAQNDSWLRDISKELEIDSLERLIDRVFAKAPKVKDSTFNRSGISGCLIHRIHEARHQRNKANGMK